MPSKKKKYNARFPAGRIKKIMQTDEEVGKVAQAVPVIISRTLELFVESLLTKSMQITQTRNAKTLTPSHMKQCILSESRFDFLKDLVKNVPDASVQEDNENNAIFEANIVGEPPVDLSIDSDDPNPRPSKRLAAERPPGLAASSSSTRTPVIQYGPRVVQIDAGKRLSFSVDSLIEGSDDRRVRENVPVPPLVPATGRAPSEAPPPVIDVDGIPPLIPISQNLSYGQNTEDNLCIDEDYDN